MLQKLFQKNLEVLSLIDTKTSQNYVADFIGNNGGFEENFVKTEDENGIYHTVAQDDFDWWSDIITLQDKVNDLQEEYLNVSSHTALLELLAEADDNDLEVRIRQEIKALSTELVYKNVLSPCVHLDNDSIYIEGYDGAFHRFMNEDGEESPCGLWGEVYYGTGYDEYGNEYEIMWRIIDAETDDEGNACNWGDPDQVLLTGRNVTDKVAIIR